VTSVKALMDELATIRETGVNHDMQEYPPGVCAAIAIREAFGSLVAVSVAAPAHRFLARQEEISRVPTQVRKEALAAFRPPTLPAPFKRAQKTVANPALSDDRGRLPHKFAR
jgi:hypothetical protein